MEVAKIQVGGTCACAYEKKTIRAGMVGATVSFAFDEYWDGLNKIAVYRCGGVVRDEYLGGDTGTIPAEALTKSGFDLEIGVYGTDAEKQIAIPTCWANLGVVRPGADPSGDPAADPSLPIWAQILAKLGNLADLNTEAKENLVAAINEALTKGGGEVDPEEIGRIVDEYLEQNPPAAYTLPIATETTLGGVKAAAATEEMTQPVGITAEGKLVTVPGQNSGGNADQSGGGLSTTASELLITILRNGVYSADQSANITALEEALASSGSGDSGDSGDDSGGSGNTGTETVTYTITNNLTNVTSNNSTASATENSAYTATLMAADGYELDTVTVTMGGVDVTSTVYDEGKITIAAVTGDVVITAAAVAESTNSGESVEMAASTLKANAVKAFKMYADGGDTAFTESMATRAGVCFLASANAFEVDTDVKITLTNAGQVYDYFCVASTDWDGVTKIGVKNEDDTAYIMANAYYTESAGESSWKNPFGTREISYTVKAGYRLLVASYVTDFTALAIDVRGVA